ncbi:3-oxoacyl-[acyl-carrier-protein] synthase-3 [Saccharomonospora amisosensis]|uniref:3-oxoacyl-[acyl-carrier-protein] synthase-3 n=1 Tax=Saccharomonospora amisosensis TaxID=1128677 RepID=A0A7X5UU42_9PSEU|nr:beta-ketoacyl-ACP synthase 3 [Saccharomonospora amisosensis]NIJ14282.1 3-oxoacyl-[acyl-carrier-protein] synthase-3 [Saccharomonospora amisosensis]
MPAIGITSTSAYTPPTVVANRDLERTLNTSDEWIRARTGIRTRRWSVDESTSGMAAKAASGALRGGTAPNLIVVATSSPDHIQPPTACLVQRALGLPGVPAFDVGAVCSGFVYALASAAALAAAHPDLAPALVVGSERYSRILDPEDRTATVFFGDGAGAVMLGRVPDGYGVLGTRLTAHGELSDVVGIEAGGTTTPLSPQAIANREHYFHMHGPQVWDYATETLPSLIKEALYATGLDESDVDLVITHQANLRLIEEVLRRCGIAKDRTETTVESFGNTAAASIPITLHQAVERGRLKDGDIVLLAGVGGGMTAGVVVVRWYSA